MYDKKKFVNDMFGCIKVNIVENGQYVYLFGFVEELMINLTRGSSS